ncbi:MAG: zincin-like metallopeptidase domain-containing protein [Erysipelotrichaceae bacterium]|nr:zincin-like metallopeptidase domain-containing protein [Erysipelotrichaceae bacterium]
MAKKSYPKKSKAEKYDEWQQGIVDYFLEDLQRVKDELEQGVENPRLAWEKEWINLMQKSMASGKDYAGKNQLILSLQTARKKYTDSRWITYNQIIKHNQECSENEKWNVRLEFLKKGSGHMTTVTFVDIKYVYDKDKRYYTEKQMNEMIKNSNGLISKNDFDKKITLGYNNVYNVSLVEGIEPEVPMVVEFDDYVIDKIVDNYLRSTGVEVINAQQNRAYYAPAEDIICLPPQGAFNDRQGYYSTLLHEIGHSIGHKDRMNREGVSGTGFTDKKTYAKEELVAEFTSVLLNTKLNIHTADSIESKYNNNLAYIESWIEILKDDPSVLMDSFDQAVKGYDYFVEKSDLELYKEYFVTDKEDTMSIAKKNILEYLNETFEDTYDNTCFNNMKEVGLLTTTVLDSEDNEYEFEAFVDLKNFQLTKMIGGEVFYQKTYDNIEQLNEAELMGLNESDLMYFDEDEKEIKKFFEKLNGNEQESVQI